MGCNWETWPEAGFRAVNRESGGEATRLEAKRFGPEHSLVIITAAGNQTQVGSFLVFGNKPNRRTRIVAGEKNS